MRKNLVVAGFFGTLIWVPVLCALGLLSLDFRWDGISGVFFSLVLSSTSFMIAQAALSSVLSVLLGLGIGTWVALSSGRGGRLLRAATEALGVFCFVLPAVAVSLLMLDLHYRIGWPPVNGWVPIVWAHVLLNVFFVAASVSRRIRSWWFSGGCELFEGARVLGAPRVRAFTVFEPLWKAEARLWAPLVFLWSATAFATVLILGGSPGKSSPEILLYFSLQNDPDSGRILILFFLQLLLGFGVSRLFLPQEKNGLLQGTLARDERSVFSVFSRVQSGLATFVWVLVAAPLLGFLTGPLAQLLASQSRESWGEYVAAVGNSLLLCCLAAGFSVALTALLVALDSRARLWIAASLGLSATLLAASWSTLGLDLWMEGRPWLQLVAESMGVVLLQAPLASLWIQHRVRSIPAEQFESVRVLGCPPEKVHRYLLRPLCRDLRSRLALVAALGVVGELSLSSFLLRDVETVASVSRKLAQRYDFSGSAWLLLFVLVLTGLGVALDRRVGRIET